MKRFLSEFLACAVLFTLVQYFPCAVAVENDVSAANQVKEAAENLSLLVTDEAPLKGKRINRFIVRGPVPVSAGDTLAGNFCVSSRPLQTNCAEFNDYYVIELADTVMTDEFTVLLADSGFEVFPDAQLSFASVDASNEGVIQAIYDLDENLAAAHDRTGGDNVLVALLDNGVDLNHEDIRNHLVEGWDIVHDAPNTSATGISFGEGHGTHIAGTIVSVAPNAKIMPLQVSEDGISYVSTVIEGIKYAEDHGAVIANCSWVTDEYSSLLERVMEESELFFVAAAGNSRAYVNNTPVYPASFKLDNLISVAAVDEKGDIAYFSNYGSDVDIAAWGYEVEGALPGNNHGRLSGTSMAAAYISGAAALALSSGTEVSELKGTLKESADKIEYMDGFISDGNIINFNNLVCGTKSLSKVNVQSAESHPGDPIKVVDVMAGGEYFGALMSNGDLWTWGGNPFGQLGNGTCVDQSVPMNASTIFGEYMYNAAGEHGRLYGGDNSAFFVSPDGKVFGWGLNENNQLRPLISVGGPYVKSPIISLVGNVQEIAVGNSTVLFRQFDNRILRTGDDLGYKTGTPVANAQPAYIDDFPNCTRIAGNTQMMCVLTDSGEAYAWGTVSEAGGPLQYKKVYEPVLLENSITDIAAGGSNTLLISNKRNAYVTNRPYNSATHNKYLYPTGAAYSDVVQVACNSNVEVYLDSSGQVWVTGANNSWGQAGHGTTGSSVIYAEAESPVPGLSNVVKVDANSAGVIALQDDGTVWVWGENGYGQLGNGTVGSHSASPVKVAFPKTYRYIAKIEPIAPVLLDEETAAEDLLLPDSVDVRLSYNVVTSVPVSWDLSSYDPNKALQTIAGELILPDDLLNTLGLVPQITIQRGDIEREEISDIPTVSQEVPQDIWLAPVDRSHAFGVPDEVSLPETVVVSLKSGKTAELPVVWSTEGYRPAQTGEQTVSGQVELPADESIVNPDGLQATLELTVLPRQYEIWDASPLELAIEVYPGMTIAQINDQLKAEGKDIIDVSVADLETDIEKMTFCGIALAEEDNPHYNALKDTPGAECALNARFPQNFIPLADDIPGPVTVKVKVTEPLNILSTELAHMDAYQSVPSEQLTGIPTQVNAVLENGMVVPVDVEWDWREYGLAKDTVGEHIVLGSLVNLPSMARQPEGQEIKATMAVNVTPVNYIISGVSGGEYYVGDAGLTLEELTAILKPTLNVRITSMDLDENFTMDYMVKVSLESEKNPKPKFDSENAGYYFLEGTLDLPANITCTNVAFKRIQLRTNAVEVINVEPAYVVTVEGTNFADIVGLPSQVAVTLSSVDPDGNHKKIFSGVDWGDGEGYAPYPETWNEDGTATNEVIGQLADVPPYVNGSGVEATLIVTITQAFDLVKITPDRFPASGVMTVKLGSTLEDIYNLLETHSVELTLKNSREETSTAEATIQLREEDNPNYDPLTEGEYTLKAYLPLDSRIRNPGELAIEIVVQTKKYKITNTKVVRVTGVQSGTPFEEVGLPEEAVVVRDDTAEEAVPVTWDGSIYDPTKIGSQKVVGTLVTPLPIHLENPNNRQPKAVVTIADPSVKILSLEQLPGDIVLYGLNQAEEENIPGLEEYRYIAQLLYEDGTTATEVISVFVELE